MQDPIRQIRERCNGADRNNRGGNSLAHQCMWDTVAPFKPNSRAYNILNLCHCRSYMTQLATSAGWSLRSTVATVTCEICHSCSPKIEGKSGNMTSRFLLYDVTPYTTTPPLWRRCYLWLLEQLVRLVNNVGQSEQSQIQFWKFPKNCVDKKRDWSINLIGIKYVWSLNADSVSLQLANCATNHQLC